jgi:antitoxin FitA
MLLSLVQTCPQMTLKQAKGLRRLMSIGNMKRMWLCHTQIGSKAGSEREMTMAQIFIRNLDDSVVQRLRKRAEAHKRSLQDEVKQILEDAAEIDYTKAWEAVERFREKMKCSGLTFSDSAELLREDRER